MDFTIKMYTRLLKILQSTNIYFQTFSENISEKKDSFIILRHDVDKSPENSLIFARIQEKMGIKGSYYFRAVPESWDEKIINQIADLGHEIGYHYENMDTCNGDVDKAWDDFCYNLSRLRKITDIKTICMHGSPLSNYNNRKLWEKYDFFTLDIIGEPYELNYKELYYLTDTGRCWDGWKFSIRDKVSQQNDWIKEGLVFHSTEDIIFSIKKNMFPNRVMFTFHPQRWHNNLFLWLEEFITQNIKNQAKKIILYKNKIKKIV